MIDLSAHLGYMFNEVSLEQRFEAAARAGFAFVEHPGPYGLPAVRVAELCDAFDLSFVQMALPAGDAKKGEKGIACLPHREGEFRESVDIGLSYALRVKSRFIHVMAGVRPEDEHDERLWDTYVRNLGIACDAASKAGLSVLIEPIGEGTIANYLIDLPEKAARAIDAVGAPNLFMLFDVFHTRNSGLDPIDSFLTYKRFIRHVHIADHPGRHEPGTGNVDFSPFFKTLQDENFHGVVGLEYVPAQSTAAGLGWTAAFPATEASLKR